MPVTLCFSLDPTRSFCSSRSEGQETRLESYLSQALDNSSAGDTAEVPETSDVQRRARIAVTSSSNPQGRVINQSADEHVRFATQAKQDVLFATAAVKSELK